MPALTHSTDLSTDCYYLLCLLVVCSSLTVTDFHLGYSVTTHHGTALGGVAATDLLFAHNVHIIFFRILFF